jgi:rubrerythrin
VDRDIICPCDYRDPDVQEFGYCYCALYVRKDVYDGKTSIAPIPERRPSAKQARTYDVAAETSTGKPVNATVTVPLKNTLNLWYCKQCGYVCFREDPPYLCPICKAKKEMFTPLSIMGQG